MLAAYHHPPRDRPRKLVRFLKLILARDPPPPPLPRARRFFTFEQEMGRRRWPVAQLDTLADLAALLDLSPGRLDWFADVRGWSDESSPSSCATTAIYGCAGPAARPGPSSAPRPA
ncbi:MAG: hypothetical protein M3550_14165 [Actinomycetota bacterium]|nr:hypothetical protein [Actinomycetota bacterium]